MATIRTSTARVNGGGLEFDVAGEGPAVVFLHPGLWDRRTWDDQFDEFARAYRVVRFDARGYGRSSRLEPGVPYSPVEDLATVMDETGVGRAALVGCSMGGGTALDFALEHPSRVAALVLAAPGVSGADDTPEEEAWWEERHPGIAALVESGDLEGAQDLRLRTMWAQLGIDDPAGARIRAIAMDNLHELTMDESGERGIDPPAFARLEDVAAPTLVLPADHDPPGTERICRVLADRIPGARLVQIPDVDHVVNVRKAAEFNRVVLGFLAEVLG
ncbi:MAG: alpha/beta fold hydrolase [Actinomycetota bacterium]